MSINLSINIYAVGNVITIVFPCKIESCFVALLTVTPFYAGYFYFPRINVLVFNFNVTRGQFSVINMQKKNPQTITITIFTQRQSGHTQGSGFKTRTWH